MKVLIVADAPGQSFWNPGKYDKIVVLDGAANQLSKIRPDIIIGDLDALSQEAQEYFTQCGVLIKKVAEQNSTDLDKGINYADDIGATSIDIINALGGRTDHTIYNTRILKKYYRPERPITIYKDDEKLAYYSNCQLDLLGKAGDRFALLAMAKACIKSYGLIYDMDNLKLELGGQESTSNAFRLQNVNLIIEGDVLMISALHTEVIRRAEQ
jgi:thiamine pyrophosphokinase